MENITHLLDDAYQPVKVLAIYRSQKHTEHLFVEAYDVDKGGELINAHPLTVQETGRLAGLLESSAGRKTDFLKSKTLLPEKVLYLAPHAQGHAVWYTPAQEVHLYFSESLGIPCGPAKVPALLWKATKEQLRVYALCTSRKKPHSATKLYHAPFFNVNASGLVCMGTVKVEIDTDCCLEDFIQRWESYFWNSYFTETHHAATAINIVQLWRKQVNSGKDFDTKALLVTGKTISDIL